jgi:MoaA/NifB/PqqE/SkfB family radical SAM enzyme
MLNVLAQIPAYMLFRATGYPRKLPLNVVVDTTFRCNSRCKTCNLWKRVYPEELSLDELDTVFASLGKTPYWFTMTGGEPFLRPDLEDICASAYRNCRPGIINVPSNGILSNISERAAEIARRCTKTQIIINLSLDGIGEKHDAIRGVPGNFERLMKTYRALKKIKAANLAVGLATVISKFNVHDIPEIWALVDELEPDSYVTEIAEERGELKNIGDDITPSPQDYAQAIDFLMAKVKGHKFHGIPKIAQSFRLQYYNIVKKTITEKRQVIPCYGAFNGAQISPTGDVWSCCIRAEPMGNLRYAGFDFKKVWFSKQAQALRRTIKNKECYCPLAGVAYTNMLCHLPTLAKVGTRILLS